MDEYRPLIDRILGSSLPRGDVCPEGVFAWGVSAWGVSALRGLPRGVSAQGDPPPCEQNSCHTLPKILRWPNFIAAGKYNMRLWQVPLAGNSGSLIGHLSVTFGGAPNFNVVDNFDGVYLGPFTHHFDIT